MTDDMTGISLAHDKRGKPCILIRLKYVKGNPVFQKVLSGEHDKILGKAQAIRDEALKDLEKTGWKPGQDRRQIRPNKANTSGVNGVRFNREKAKGGNGWYNYWQVSWSDTRDGKKWPRAKSFYFSKYGSALDAFAEAVVFRQAKELEMYGHTLIDLDDIDDYWQVAEGTIK